MEALKFTAQVATLIWCGIILYVGIKDDTVEITFPSPIPFAAAENIVITNRVTVTNFVKSYGYIGSGGSNVRSPMIKSNTVNEVLFESNKPYPIFGYGEEIHREVTGSVLIIKYKRIDEPNIYVPFNTTPKYRKGDK